MIMRVFVAGGTGVVGRRLVPQLVGRGHQVTATTTSPTKLGLLGQLGADAIGVNCGEGPAQVLRVVRAMRPVVGDTPLAARPNAGGPAEVGGRLVYPATPTYLGELMHALLDEGVAIVGGCCGTGPAHTAAIVEATKDRGPRPRVEVVSVSEPPDPLTAAPSSTELTALAAALASDRFAVAVEMEPPRSFSAATLVAE